MTVFCINYFFVGSASGKIIRIRPAAGSWSATLTVFAPIACAISRCIHIFMFLKEREFCPLFAVHCCKGLPYIVDIFNLNCTHFYIKLCINCTIYTVYTHCNTHTAEHSKLFIISLANSCPKTYVPLANIKSLYYTACNLQKKHPHFYRVQKAESFLQYPSPDLTNDT